jgi:hypothetical protein
MINPFFNILQLFVPSNFFNNHHCKKTVSNYFRDIPNVAHLIPLLFLAKIWQLKRLVVPLIFIIEK